MRAAVPSIERVVVYCRAPSEAARVLPRTVRARGAHREAAGTGRRRHGDDVEGSGAARRLAATRRARLRRRRERPLAARARQRRARARRVRLLRLAGAGADRVGRPDRAGRARRARLARGARAAGRRRRRVQAAQSDEDIVVFKSNGIAAWDIAVGARVVERARERGMGTELWPRALEVASRVSTVSSPSACIDLGPVEQPQALLSGSRLFST